MKKTQKNLCENLYIYFIIWYYKNAPQFIQNIHKILKKRESV